MTAPEMVELIAKTLWVNGFNDDDPWDDLLPDDCDKDEYLAKAHAVVEALTEAGTVEWGVAWKGAGPSGVLTFDSEEDAREAVELGGLLSRLTLPWVSVE